MSILRTIGILLCALLFAPCVAVADDDEKNEPERREFSDDEVAAADRLRLTFTPAEQALYNGLRYLLRPGYEEPLLAGRYHHPCPMDPIEDVGEGPLTTLEMLRLWAVLDAGMPITRAVEDTVQRLLETQPREVNRNLAPHIVPMAVCLAAWRRDAIDRQDELRNKAQAFFDRSLKEEDATDARSALIQPNYIDNQWFANQMWRSLGYRYALELGLEIDGRDWKRDLRALARSYSRDRGWSCRDEEVEFAGQDMHPNLMAMVALSMATTAPEDALTKGFMRTLQNKAGEVPGILTRLEDTYDGEPLNGSRLALIRTLDPTFAPEKTSADDWRGEVMRQGLAHTDPDGGVRALHTLLSDLGLDDGEWKRDERRAAETALTCLAITGGLLRREEPPLMKHELSDIGRTLYAFSVLHASKLRRGGGNLDERAAYAIEYGCDFLADTQNPQGSFDGVNSQYPGNSALALLAMLHGGWDRESPAIRQGVNWLVDDATMSGRSTYDCACVLMMFQKYFEPEQEKHRILWVESEDEFEEARRNVWKDIPRVHREFIQKMMDEIDDAHQDTDKGGWAYGRAALNVGSDVHTDNSISQYAMLGTKAASLLGAEIDLGHVEHEALRLIRQYWEDPSEDVLEFEFSEDDERETTTEAWDGAIRPGGWGYSCGQQGAANLQMTAAGMSSLSVALDELKVRGKLNRTLRRKLLLTRKGAEQWVKKHYYTREHFEGSNGAFESTRRDGWGIFYNLYSVERACELAGVRRLGGEIDWYTIGAEALIHAQNYEGDWGRVAANAAANTPSRPQTVNTCMAILFLKRASLPVITEHRQREKERKDGDEPRSPITPGPEERKAKEQAEE